MLTLQVLSLQIGERAQLHADDGFRLVRGE